MLSNKDVDKLLKAQIIKIKNDLENKIENLERVLLDPKKSIAEKLATLDAAVELEKKYFKGEGLPNLH